MYSLDVVQGFGRSHFVRLLSRLIVLPGAFQSSEMNRFHQQQILEISLELKRLYQELKMSFQFRLALIPFVFAILAVTTTNVVLSASWSLSGDMQVVSNPSPLYLPQAISVPRGPTSVVEGHAILPLTAAWLVWSMAKCQIRAPVGFLVLLTTWQ